MDLFVYGTLMDPELVRRLTGRIFSRCPARLADFRRIEPPGSYPYIVPCPGSTVEGVVLRNLDDRTLRVLDEYEGNLYLRTEVTADTAAGPRRCVVYVARPGAFERRKRA